MASNTTSPHSKRLLRELVRRSSKHPIPSHQRQNDSHGLHPTLRFLTLLLSLAVLRVPVAQANVVYVPFPTKDELRSLQLQAYACSRENDAELCDATRKTADPLMDHPRLPAACKDAVWELIQASTPATPNSFQRRDSIDRPARRLTVVCAKPVKPQKQATPPPGKA